VRPAPRLLGDARDQLLELGPGQVAVETVDYPKLEVPQDVASATGMSRKADHAVILRNVSTNICGSDQHMVRGRTTAPVGQTLGHEITGEVIEKGSDVQFLQVGDICSVPFNIACGRCRNCHEGQTGVCLNVNPARAGSAYGYVDMGGWLGGQAEYVMVPFADFNLLKFPDRDQALAKIRDLTMLSDIFPTGYHGAKTAGVTTGSTVYVAGAGPVGLAAAYSAQLLGAAVVIVGDLNAERLKQAESFGCETVDISADATLEGLGKLKPSFQAIGQMGYDATALRVYSRVERIEHVHTPGNSSGIVDGAALMLVGSAQKGQELGLQPRARIIATAVTSTDPTIMLTGPAPATRKALARAGLKIQDIDLFEVNEAFASVVLKFIKDMGVDPDKVNVNGGAIALGHPLGATGCMILGTLLDELDARQLRYGLATLCVGGGMGIATIIERV